MSIPQPTQLASFELLLLRPFRSCQFCFIQQQLSKEEAIFMRRRSGAIHSDSEENFATLAELSINTTGIFYDDKLNRRAMARLTSKHANYNPNSSTTPYPNSNIQSNFNTSPNIKLNVNSNLETKSNTITSINSITQQHYKTSPTAKKVKCSPQLFSNFDFNIEFDAIRQEREELERMQGLKQRQVNVAILSSDPAGTIHHLCSSFGLKQVEEGSVRGVDLVVGNTSSTIYKYWVLSRSAAVESDPLLALYLARCRIVIEVKEAQHLVQVVRCTEEGWERLSDSVLTPLTC